MSKWLAGQGILSVGQLHYVHVEPDGLDPPLALLAAVWWDLGSKLRL